jgi:hypothetical protein
MKNVLFTLILMGMILCQIIFWLNHFGLVKDSAAKPAEVQPQVGRQYEHRFFAPVFLAAAAPKPEQDTSAAGTPPVAETVQQAVDRVESANKVDQEERIPQMLEKETDAIPAQMPSEPAPTAVTESEPTQQPEPTPQTQSVKPAETTKKFPLKDELALFHISCRFAKGLIAVCNFVIVAGAILYCLTLLMCVKISLAGRLGGINHIVRAFFISLFLLVILIPWQVVLPKVLIGSVWLPGELLCGGWSEAQCLVFWKVMLYLRFCGLWLVAVWLLVGSQIRSARWARATLRRLGVVR